MIQGDYEHDYDWRHLQIVLIVMELIAMGVSKRYLMLSIEAWRWFFSVFQQDIAFAALPYGI